MGLFDYVVNMSFFPYISFILMLTQFKPMISFPFQTYSAVPVGSILMRATLLYSDSTFPSIFEPDVNLRKYGCA